MQAELEAVKIQFFQGFLMLRISEIRLRVDHADDAVRAEVLRRLNIADEQLRDFRIVRRSVDARGGRVWLVYTADVEVDAERDILSGAKGSRVSIAEKSEYKFGCTAGKNIRQRPVIVGAGPCGLMAAVVLAEAGFCPIVVDRGHEVSRRVCDVYGFWEDGKLDTESNAAFGEGGAGTFSDGKLTTQIKDKAGRCGKVLRELAEAGGGAEILVESRPHVGTDRLVTVVANLRRKIEKLGGEVRFESRVDDVVIEKGKVRGVRLSSGDEILSDAVIIAIGHSARDTFSILLRCGAAMEQKAFSIGVRVEHKQRMIDKSQYGRFAGNKRLDAADYRLSHKCADGRGVYTFCMCPGGEVIAASSEAGGVVTNGMSRHKRNAKNANSAVLVGVGPSDFGGDDVLSGVEFQRKWERKAFKMGGRNYHAPVEMLGDFLKGLCSGRLGEIRPSYTPGVEVSDVAGCLPGFVVGALREGFGVFDRKLRGFGAYDAVLTGVETRSSSPVRILRGEDMENLNIAGLYPAGEGAGYAGGIVSAAVDGLKVAEAVGRKIIECG